MSKFTKVTYEAHTSYGATMSETFLTKEDCLKAIASANRRQKRNGYTVVDYFVMICTYTRVFGENGDLLSECTLRERI